MRLGRVQHIHMVGIGGTGMSGIAEVLVHEGFKVSGSDTKATKTTLRLEYLGCSVHIGHDANWVDGADVLVYSSAVPVDNPEIVRANQLGIPVIKRGEMLAEIMRLKVGIAVAGAHGKTTSTTMLGHILDAASFDPTVVVGGRILSVDGNSIRGTGDYVVAEADESDGSFLLLSHAFAIVTNIDREHMDHYGSYETLQEAFVTFMNQVPFWGAIALCADDPKLIELSSKVNRRFVTYGFNSDAQYRAQITQMDIGGSEFTMHRPEGEPLNLRVPTSGEHNVQNALGAAALASEMGVPAEAIAQGLEAYPGIHRRLEQKFQSPQITLFDDYAHHPTEIAATLRAIRRASDQPIIAIFQPHRYTRTADLWEQFADGFQEATQVWVLPIYSAGESPQAGIDHAELVQQMRSQLSIPVTALAEHELLDEVAQIEDAIVITLGAGSITTFSEDIAHALETRA